MTRISTSTRKLATVFAAAALVAGASTAAVAGTSNNASAGNDRTMSTQYSATLLPIGGTSGERNRWDMSRWTGVTTKTASNPRTNSWGFTDRDYYSRDYYTSWNGTPVRYNAQQPNAR